MKHKPLLVVLWLVALAIPSRAAVDEARLLASIAQVETPNGVRRGRAGELTRYQILPATWRRFSSVPMARATPAEVERVARCILREITEQLDAQHLPHDAHEYALRWNAGARATFFQVTTWHYARRVSAIYEVTP